MKTQKGFTLIELLVVIAIIGILSSVVLASLNTARGKGADAAVKANLANIRAQAELYYDANGNAYGTAASALCTANLFADPTITSAVTAATNASGGAARCQSSATAYATQVPLKTAGYWCVDSTGAAKYATSTLLSTTACP